MANPRAFISFDYDNNSGERIYFTGQSKNSKTPFNIEDWSSKTVLPQNEWEELIKAKTAKCHFLIVLAGLKTATATGVKKEIAFAKEQNVPVFGVYVGDANTTTDLPTGLQRNRTIKWTWDGISSAIDQMMTEGKNK
jgi:S-adenosylhomocysteine hydrolase